MVNYIIMLMLCACARLCASVRALVCECARVCGVCVCACVCVRACVCVFVCVFIFYIYHLRVFQLAMLRQQVYTKSSVVAMPTNVRRNG